MPEVTGKQLGDWARLGRGMGGMDPGGGDTLNIPPYAAWIGWRIRAIIERLRGGRWQANATIQQRSGEIAVLLGRAVAEKAIELAMEAEAGGTRSGAERFVNAFVGNYCGNGRRPPKGPWPHGIELAFGPHDLMLIAGQLQAGAANGGGDMLASAAQRVATAAGG